MSYRQHKTPGSEPAKCRVFPPAEVEWGMETGTHSTLLRKTPANRFCSREMSVISKLPAAIGPINQDRAG